METAGTLAWTASLRDIGRLKLAAGDTSGAVRVWRDYLMVPGRAEPAQRRLDDEIRKEPSTIERAKRRGIAGWERLRRRSQPVMWLLPLRTAGPDIRSIT